MFFLFFFLLWGLGLLACPNSEFTFETMNFTDNW
jgi:hypothetical protein